MEDRRRGKNKCTLVIETNNRIIIVYIRYTKVATTVGI